MMHEAFRTWDAAGEPLESVEARIHDGVPRQQLHGRARGYARRLLGLAPWLRVRRDDLVVEVGPGVGYVMQAFAEQSAVAAVTGLDVAPAMIGHARARLERDGLPVDRFPFQLYDGVTFPWPDDTVDVFYSVAAIQHIPKPFAYHVLMEMQRCLKPGGTALVHLLGWSMLATGHIDFRSEIRHQVTGTTTHWHHFYDREELEAVLGHGLGIREVRIEPDGGSLWVAWRK